MKIDQNKKCTNIHNHAGYQNNITKNYPSQYSQYFYTIQIYKKLL